MAFMVSKVFSSSTVIIAILFAVSGSSFALSDKCNITRRLVKSIFGHSDAVRNTSVAGMLTANVFR